MKWIGRSIVNLRGMHRIRCKYGWVPAVKPAKSGVLQRNSNNTATFESPHPGAPHRTGTTKLPVYCVFEEKQLSGMLLLCTQRSQYPLIKESTLNHKVRASKI